ncbi:MULTISPECIES: hypothetical protein [unclassified Bradyrhizobium]|uniref:hypothetical protein n=1 Tax=unclassified Bradyrhizobium TaxID=2631580 RepID=UPI0033917C68
MSDADEKRVPMTVFLCSVFVMDLDGKAAFDFEAKNFAEAFELCKEDWVREDLATMTSNGVPLCSSGMRTAVNEITFANVVARHRCLHH